MLENMNCQCKNVIMSMFKLLYPLKCVQSCIFKLWREKEADLWRLFLEGFMEFPQYSIPAGWLIWISRIAHTHQKQIQCLNSGTFQSTAKLREKGLYLFKNWFIDFCTLEGHFK